MYAWNIVEHVLLDLLWNNLRINNNKKALTMNQFKEYYQNSYNTSHVGRNYIGTYETP